MWPDTYLAANFTPIGLLTAYRILIAFRCGCALSSRLREVGPAGTDGSRGPGFRRGGDRIAWRPEAEPGARAAFSHFRILDLPFYMPFYLLEHLLIVRGLSL